MEKKTTSRHLKVVFDTDKLQDLSTQLALKTAELRSQEDEKKEVMSDFTATLNRLKAETNSLATKINNGYEYRSVDCDIDYLWDEGNKKIIRQDTQEVVETLAITPEEMQTEFPLGEQEIEGSGQDEVPTQEKEVVEHERSDYWLSLP